MIGQQLNNMISKIINRQFSTAGALLTWGETTFGWGREPNNNFYNPGFVEGFNDVTHVASGPYHLLFRTSDGSIFSTGLGDNGRLGNKSTNSSDTPELIENLKGADIKLAAGLRHSLALTGNGDVYSWGFGGRTTGIFNYLRLFRCQSPLGLGDSGDVTEPTLIESVSNISQIAAGNDMSLALGNNGKVYGWGHRISSIEHKVVQQPSQLEQINYFLHKHHSNVVKMEAVDNSVFFLLENGRIYVVGYNNGGVFGTRHNPRIIEDNRLLTLTKTVDDDFAGQKITNFEVSSNSLIFTTDSGSIFYTGMHKKYRPQRFPFSGEVSSIFATSDSVGVIGKDGSVNYINDQFIDNSVKRQELIICKDPSLSKAVKIGGTHKLRYAIVA